MDKPEVISSCYAFNIEGQRCNLTAGHPGDHALTITWTDEELWQPGRTVTIKALEPPAWTINPASNEALVEHLTPDPPKGSGRCFCEHPMHVGVCGAPDGEHTCDCSNGIEI